MGNCAASPAQVLFYTTQRISMKAYPFGEGNRIELRIEGELSLNLYTQFYSGFKVLGFDGAEYIYKSVARFQITKESLNISTDKKGNGCK